MKKSVILVGALLVVSSQAIAQQEKENLIEEVTVASKMPQQLYRTGKNVKLLTHRDLEKFKGQSLTEVLQQVSGFHITGTTSNAPEPKSPKIRGGKLANILVLIDGVPVKDVTGNDYNAMDLRLLALENIESIEVLNGASSVLYGSNAAGAVINIRTHRNTLKKAEGTVSARAGSYGTFAQNALLRGKTSGFTYQVSGFNEKSDGFSSAGGTDFEKDGFEKQNASATLGYSTGPLTASLSAGWNHHFFDYDTGAYTDGLHRGDDTQQYLGGNVNLSYGKGELVLQTRYTSNERVIQGFSGGTYRDEYFYEGQNFFSELFNRYKVSDRFSFTAGLHYETQNMGSKALPWGGTTMEDGLRREETTLSNFDVFAHMNANYRGFHLDAGARMTDLSKFGSHLVYSINPYYLWEMETLYYRIGYSYATAFIAPTLYQSYGTLPYTLPNFDLQPETNRSHEVDLSLGKKDRSIVLNASLFLTREKEVFAYQMNPDFTGNFVNVDENEIRGAEIGLDYRLNGKLKLGGNFSFVEKEKEATRLRQPKQRVNSYAEVTPLPATRITLAHQFVSKRADYYFNPAFERVDVQLDPYHLFSLNLNQKLGSSFELFGNIGNLFNTSYTEVAGFNTRPRNYTLGFGYRF